MRWRWYEQSLWNTHTHTTQNIIQENQFTVLDQGVQIAKNTSFPDEKSKDAEGADAIHDHRVP